MMAGTSAVRNNSASFSDSRNNNDDRSSSLPPVGYLRTARTPRRASPSYLHDSALCNTTTTTASSTHAKKFPNSTTPTSLSSSSSSDEDKNSSVSLMSAPTGTKLAVSTDDSPAGGEVSQRDLLEVGCVAEEVLADGSFSMTDAKFVENLESKTTPLQIEKEIALNQLQELEAAIKVRKVARVDGRKVRWIEYRARKAQEEKNNNNCTKPKRNSRNSRAKENCGENDINVNNNNNKNANKMKADVITTPSPTTHIVGTSNVLESMKMQFLQGTENIEGSVAVGNGETQKSPDPLQKRKSIRTRKSLSSPKENENLKKMTKTYQKRISKKSKVTTEGPDKEILEISSQKAIPREVLNESNEVNIKAENTNDVYINSEVTVEDNASSLPSTPVMGQSKVSSPEVSPIKEEITIPNVRSYFKSLTKGLREVRKVENGPHSEVPKSKTGDSINTTLTSCALSPITVPDGKSDTEFKVKPPSSSPPLLLTPSPRSKSVENIPVSKKSVTPKKLKKHLSKSVERPSVDGKEAVNGHSILQNGTPTGKDGMSMHDLNSVTDENAPPSDDKMQQLLNSSQGNFPVKRTRGRPPKRKLNLTYEDTKITPRGKSSKKFETVVVDVHNTMNGEPQTVIPLNKPILRGKKGMSPSKQPKNVDQDIVLVSSESQSKTSLKISKKKSLNNSETKESSLTTVNVDSPKKQDSVKKKKYKKVSNEVKKQEETENKSTEVLVNVKESAKTNKGRKAQKNTSLEALHSAKDNEANAASNADTRKRVEAAANASTTEGKIEREERSLSGRVIRRTEAARGIGYNSGAKRSPSQKAMLPLKENVNGNIDKGTDTQKASEQASLPKCNRIRTAGSKVTENVIVSEISTPKSSVVSEANKNQDAVVLPSLPAKSTTSVLNEPPKNDEEVANGVKETSIDEKSDVDAAKESRLKGLSSPKKLKSKARMALKPPANVADDEVQVKNETLLEEDGEKSDVNAEVITIRKEKRDKENQSISKRKKSQRENDNVSKIYKEETSDVLCIDTSSVSNLRKSSVSENELMQADNSKDVDVKMEEIKIEEHDVSESCVNGTTDVEGKETVVSEEVSVEGGKLARDQVCGSPMETAINSKNVTINGETQDGDTISSSPVELDAKEQNSLSEIKETTCSDVIDTPSCDDGSLKVINEPKSDNEDERRVFKSSGSKTPEVSADMFYAKSKKKSLPNVQNIDLGSEKADIVNDKIEGASQDSNITEISYSETVPQPVNVLQENETVAASETDESVVVDLASAMKQVPESQINVSSGKSREKVPRILKQLLQDEGVQNMLKSMGAEAASVPEGALNDTGSSHKLRPKRPTEPMLSSSPELDGVVDALFPKKRKRWSEVDTLYMDEGVLNLLTSLDPHSRRAGQDDAASDTSQASSSRSVKTNKSGKSLLDVNVESRKRKLSGTSTISNTSTKSMQPPDAKRLRPEVSDTPPDPYEYKSPEEPPPAETTKELVLDNNSNANTEVSPVPKKKGRPALPMSVKQKNKAIRMQLKLQRQKKLKTTNSDLVHPSTEENQNILATPKAKDPEKQTEEDDDIALSTLVSRSKQNEKAPVEAKVSELQVTEKVVIPAKVIPPLKIKLPESVTLSPVASTTLSKPQICTVTTVPIQPAIVTSFSTLHPLSASQMQRQRHTAPILAIPKLRPTSIMALQSVSIHPQQLQQLPHPSNLQPKQIVATKVPTAVAVSSSTHIADVRLPSHTTLTPAPRVYPVVQQHLHQSSLQLPSVQQSSRNEITVTPTSSGLTSLVRANECSGQGRGRPRIGEALRQSQRASVRQITYNHYRDISLRKFNNFTQIILSPSTTKMKNSFNSRVLRELCEALSTLKRDESVRMVLLTATGPTFCQGVDLTALQHPNVEIRKKNAENLVRGIKDFLKTLVQFPKPIVAGVNGNAMGLGVTMLPLFDLVFATDSAEFYLPYAKLGQVPEGGATYTFPNLFGKLKSTQLFLGHKISASKAQEIGLASEAIWPATYQQELIPKVALLASQSAQSMEATKALMNHHLITKLELTLETECRLLLQHWMSPHFAHLCKRFFESHHIHLQKPVNLPL
ncbi:hypothetical protein SK128_015127 [Halocaridina rubra]|uniref:Uncharacterized protein n=1 Tax=Halocaridina rubra TaxID=373956 RepID=A0AAN8WDL3_HALRR